VCGRVARDGRPVLALSLGGLAFVGLLAVAFVNMVLLALAIVAPGSDGGLIRG
jgi:hypothetical protein